MSGNHGGEDVLLQVAQVYFRKVVGTLYVLASRLAWCQEGRDNFAVSVSLEDVERQKISPAHKAKVQLQLTLLNTENVTFHFASDSATADRDAVKNILAQLLPQFRRKLDADLDGKMRIMQENPELLQLYKTLVTNHVMTADEFWAGRRNMLESPSSVQNVGVSSAFLADIQPKSDSTNGLRYNLTPDTMMAIFKVYPTVKAAYTQHVPHNCTEQEFWAKFFQSHYFHRDRLIPQGKSGDMFFECALKDEKMHKRILAENSKTSFLYNVDFEQDEAEKSSTNTSSASQAVQKLIERTNHHNTRVLRIGLDEPLPQEDIEPPKKKSKHKSKDSPPDEPVIERSSVKINVELEDLRGDVDNESFSGSSLHLQPTAEFLSCASSSLDISHVFVQPTDLQYKQAVQNMKSEMSSWSSSCPAVPNTSFNIFRSYMPSNATKSHEAQLSSCSSEIQKEIRTVYLALQELLRHFWACFPVTSTELENKLSRMNSSLVAFQKTNFETLRSRLVSAGCHSCISHPENLLNRALDKYQQWSHRLKKC